MILLDFSGVVVASVHVGINEFGEPTEDIVRHLIMNSVRRLNTKFKAKYGDMVICCDNRKYWRDEVFPHYKYKRRVERNKRRAEAKDNIDWAEVYGWIAKVQQELVDHFPYTVIDIVGCEADDIIGSLVKAYRTEEKILILSRDGDFKQLQGPMVQQYDPIGDKVIKVKNPRLYLSEHIIRGDSGDGIPNILSPSDTFFTGTKQKSVMTKWIENCIGEDPKEFCTTEEMLNRYYENESWIDLTKTPDNLYKQIQDVYNKGTENDNSKIYQYLIDSRLTRLVDVMNDFHNQSKHKEARLF